MCKKIFIPFLVLLFSASGLFAQTTLKTLTLSTLIKNEGNPRIVRDGFTHVWLAAWRQTAPNKIVGRIIKSDGTLNPSKTLAANVTNAADNFDIFWDSTDYNYLLAFENAKGLHVQLFNGNLQKKGPATLIEGGISNSSPRLNYDPTGKRFLIFWLSSDSGVAGRALKVQVLDATGKTTGASRTISTAAAGKTFSSLSASVNPKSGNFMVLTELSSGASSSLVSFNIKPDGSSAGGTKTLQPNTAGLSTTADASFVDAGTGFSIWNDKTSIKFRKLSPTGGFSGPTKVIANAGDTQNSSVTGILFDSLNNLFIGAWGKGNTLQAMAINPTSGAFVKSPFVVTTNTAASGSRNVTTSYDAQVGNAIAVWDDVVGTGAAAKFQTKAAIFFVQTAQGQQGVSIGDNFFSPSTISIRQGTTLTWTHNGNTQHTVTSDTGIFNSGTISRGAVFEFRFTNAGTFNYHCTIHGISMSGTVTVTANGDGGTRY